LADGADARRAIREVRTARRLDAAALPRAGDVQLAAWHPWPGSTSRRPCPAMRPGARAWSRP